MRTDSRAFAGVDIGTTSIAAVVTDSKGKVLKTVSVPNPSCGDVTDDGRHEQDADAILKTVNAVVAECEAFARESGLKIGRIGWTGQMHGLVAVDRNLHAITPFVTWRDARCAPPKFACGIMEDWRKRGKKGIFRVLCIPGYVIARRTGRCMIDSTFRASLGTEEQLARFAEWLPETDDSLMIGDNQAGVYAAQKIKSGAPVINIGTSGQFSRVTDVPAPSGNPRVQTRPYPGGRSLFCRASYLGGESMSRLRRKLRCSWQAFNDRAESDPRIAACIGEVVSDMLEGVDLKGVRTVVGVGNAVRLNPCLTRHLEKRYKIRCLIPDIEEMAAWGAALFVMDGRSDILRDNAGKCSSIAETLRHEILLGKYAVGSRFPSEQMLVRRFKVARATVSNALSELKREGMLRVKVGSGAFVTSAAKGKGSIGLIVPGRYRQEIFDPICREIEKEIDQLGYTVISCGRLKGSAEERKAAALAFAKECVRSHVAGVIMEPIEFVPGKDETTEEMLSVLDRIDIPVVLIDRDVPQTGAGRKYDLVGIDNFDAGYRLGELMSASGAKRIVFLHFKDSAPTVRRRIFGVAQAVLDAGLRWNAKSVIELDFGDSHALADIMHARNPPDAIICSNDKTATFVIRTLKAIGIPVPDEVRVSGFDDQLYASRSTIPLTTMHQPCAELGSVALHTLIERILNCNLPPREIMLRAELVRRCTA